MLPLTGGGCDTAWHFYLKLGFSPMRTAMAIFRDKADAIRRGLISAA